MDSGVGCRGGRRAWVMAWMVALGPATAMAEGDGASPGRNAPTRVASDGGTQAETSYAEGRRAGRRLAEEARVSKWFWLGAGAGCVGSATGCVLAGAAGYLSSPEQPAEALDRSRSESWRRGLREGYEEKLQHRRMMAALTGGGIATLVTAAVGLGVWVLYVAVFIQPSGDYMRAPGLPALGSRWVGAPGGAGRTGMHRWLGRGPELRF